MTIPIHIGTNTSTPILNSLKKSFNIEIQWSKWHYYFFASVIKISTYCQSSISCFGLQLFHFANFQFLNFPLFSIFFSFNYKFVNFISKLESPVNWLVHFLEVRWIRESILISWKSTWVNTHKLSQHLLVENNYSRENLESN